VRDEAPSRFKEGKIYMAPLTFTPPGYLEDLDAAGRQAWHQLISDLMDRAKTGDPTIPFNAPRPQFFNPAQIDIGPGAATEDVQWTAFPRVVALQSATDHQRWKKADSSREVQDEYCEWSVKRNAENKITTIVFTCEGPEYWRLLARHNPAKVLELYRTHVDPSVAHDDLFDSDGRYIARNRWNDSVSSGAMHLIQRNNTLGDEVEIAGAASIVRSKADGSLMTDTRELIECGQYGVIERNSDPVIGARVNYHARNRSDVTIADPVGVYFAGLDTQRWATPDGTDPGTFWRYTRGDRGRYVRAVLEVPADKPYVLGDVTIDGNPIQFGGQVADFIQMTIRAVAARIGQSTAKPLQGCVDAAGMAGLSAEAFARRPSRRG
jgi:hypothetical protein